MFCDYCCSIWVFLYVLAPQSLTYRRIPILTDRNNTISCPPDFRGRPKRVAGCRQEARKAEGSTSPSLYHCWSRELLLVHAWGSQCKKRQNRKRGKKEKCALNSVPAFRSPPFSFLPHAQDHTLALAPPGMPVCLPAPRRLPISSHLCLSRKGKCPKRNPKSSVVQPQALPRSTATLSCAQAGERRI